MQQDNHLPKVEEKRGLQKYSIIKRVSLRAMLILGPFVILGLVFAQLSDSISVYIQTNITVIVEDGKGDINIIDSDGTDHPAMLAPTSDSRAVRTTN